MTRTRSAARHVLERAHRRPLRRLRFRFRVRPAGLAATAGAILVGVLAAASTAAGSYAYLNSTASTGSAGTTVTAGTSSLTLQSGSGAASSSITMPSTAWNRMLPGDVVGQPLIITNTGATPLALTTRLSAVSAWEFRIASGACPSGVLPGAALTATATNFGTLAAGASTTVCLQAALPASAPAAAQGTTAAVSLLIDGVQTP